MKCTRVLAGMLLAALLLQPAIAATGPALTVDTTADRHAISPDIYGLNFADPALADELALPVERWGGEAMEVYNWQLGSVNLSNDWYFENLSDCQYFFGDCSGGNTPYYRAFVERDLARGTRPLIELPLAGYVPKDAPLAHPYTCSFPRTQFPVQQSFDTWDTNCGNGRGASGGKLSANPTTSGVAVGAAFDGGWVSDLVARYGNADAGGVRLYSLGNEPALWRELHFDFHPSATTYDELFARTRDAAIAVKQADPGAKLLAFSEWGWPNYFCSAADNTDQGCFATSPDRAAHGGVELAAWLLQQFAADAATRGTRLIDYFDLHYYMQGGTTADITRSLWDASYVDPSWIGATIRLIPRMHDWVNANYPGTRIALTEYNLSIAGQDALNAVIQADVLGIFAREGLDLATRWEMAGTGAPDGTGAALAHIYDAFRLYRNYDGAGARFGDTYVRSTSADQAKLSLYSALRASDGKLTIVVVNKTTGALSSTLAVAGSTLSGNAQVWRWAGSGIARQADVALGGAAITFPAQSMTLFVQGLCDRGTLAFGSASYSRSESQPTATITVSRSGGACGAAGVSWATANGTALAGADYTAASGHLDWADGASGPKTFTVGLLNDTLDEATETVNLSLSGATGAALGATAASVLKITDDDPLPTVYLDRSARSVIEGGPGNVLLRLSAASGRRVVVTLGLSGTASPGSDYTAPAASIALKAGLTQKSIALPTVDDTVFEGSETVVLDLIGATNATVGSPARYTLTITDND